MRPFRACSQLLLALAGFGAACHSVSELPPTATAGTRADAQDAGTQVPEPAADPADAASADPVTTSVDAGHGDPPEDATGVAPPAPTANPFGTVPFPAWVASSDVHAIPSRDKQWPSLGVLRYGDRVEVVRCEPSCEAEGAYAYLAPFGSLRLAHLRAMPEPDEARASGPDAAYVFGRIRPGGARARSAPSTEAPSEDRYQAGDELVFRDEPTPEGWLRRPNGLYVDASDVDRLIPSPFEGWRDPPETFLFVRRDTTLTLDDGTTRPLRRYDRLPMERVLNGGRIRVEGGTVPRADVRNGRARRRPSRVPAEARWVHIDLEQQVLTAYEGDRMVFATLVSTGVVEGTTQVGTFQVRRKLRYTTMKSAAEGDEYFVEGIPYVQYFHGSVALHAAYWHDRFGTPLSHGCVNLSFADARFLFEWSPGEVPDGWRAVNPEAAYGTSLFVRVERIRR